MLFLHTSAQCSPIGSTHRPRVWLSQVGPTGSTHAPATGGAESGGLLHLWHPPLEPRGKDMTHTGIAALVAQGFGLLTCPDRWLGNPCVQCVAPLSLLRGSSSCTYQSGLEHCLLVARA